MLRGYYNQEGSPGLPVSLLAPRSDRDKVGAAKDPDTLWEVLGSRFPKGLVERSPACHAASGQGAFVDCTGARLALSAKVSYEGGLTLFSASRGFYGNRAIVETAADYVLYHAFVHEFDAVHDGTYRPTTQRGPRDYKAYHRSMMAAYERHMRDVLFRMFRETRADTESNRRFQADLTREAGLLAMQYARTLAAMDHVGAWVSTIERREALTLLNAFNQRIWWEWVVPQPDGPRTAGFADLGSQATFDSIVREDPGQAGKDRFRMRGQEVGSLRPAAFDAGPFDGLWFDADYAMPGEWYCNSFSHGAGGDSEDYSRCMAHARRASLGGTRSPFGQYYGKFNCIARTGDPADSSCGETNLGSMAEEWLWTYVGARAGMGFMKAQAERGDPDLPYGLIGPHEYGIVTDRVGYGVSGWHGGSGKQDDMEWTWSGQWPLGSSRSDVVAIRTLSAASHDGEAQNGRHSLGERDVSPRSSATNGNTWQEDRQEYPGAIENHAPGPHPVYGTVLFGLVLGDKAGELSGSLYDGFHRNHPDEFSTWTWLLQGSYYRCSGAADPGDGRCFDVDSGQRRALYIEPGDTSVPLAWRYLWRDVTGLISGGSVLDGPSVGSTCGGGKGLPWAKMIDGNNRRASGYMLSEGGYGSYNLLLQGLGGYMRLASARWEVGAPEPSLEAQYELRRESELIPWYNEAKETVQGIIGLYSDGSSGYGYVPDIENARCAGSDGPLTWSESGRSFASTVVHRARWYSAAANWYWWYDSNWLAVGRSEEPTTSRTGAWVDSVVVIEEPHADKAITRLDAGELDVYASPISSPSTADKIMNDDNLNYKTSYGSYNELVSCSPRD
jgi:hypothetical protein